MNVRTACPETEEFRQLIKGSLALDRQQECTDHLDACSCCQAKLEEIATDGSNLSSVVKNLAQSEPLATSAYWPALKRMEAGGQQVATPPPTARLQGVSLDFLSPASDSAYLGRLAHFDVMRVLGRGGMGVVLEAFDSRLRRNVAIKVLDPQLAGDDVARQRFCREARAAASITHENVVAVHQVEKAGGDGLPYLVMQVVLGESLEQRLAREKKLPPREVVRLGMQAAQGLAAAHEQGLIHRDIKPGNILLEAPQGRVKLTDFGLARAMDDIRLTHTGFVSGTPLYMAPEQALGDESDSRSDLFSLGAILYEMCAGKPPFTGPSALAILRQIAEEKHRPLREVDPAIPDWLAETIDRLLAKKPADRIQTAGQLAELLEFQWALMKTTSEDVPTVCKIEAAKRATRNRWLGALVGATFLVLGLIGGSFLATRNRSTSAAGAASVPLAVLAANAGAVSSVEYDPTGDTVAMAVEDGSVRLWDLPTKSIKETFNAHRGNVWSSRFSPSGDLLATAGDDGLIKLWKPSHPVAIKTFEHAHAVRGMAFAPDGKTLFAGDRDGGLRVWSLDEERPPVEGQQPGAIYAVAASSSGAALATGGSDRVVRLWNAGTLTQRLSLEGHAGPIYALAFNPDGGRLASAGWDKTVRIWDAGSGTLIKSWPAHEADISGVVFSPDGKRLATGSLDGSVKLWNAETGQLLATYFDNRGGVQTVAFNHDGTQLAAGGRDGAIRVWRVD